MAIPENWRSSYIDTIAKCSRRYPDFLHLNKFLRNCGPHSGRATVLEFHLGKSVERRNFADPDDLSNYLQDLSDCSCKHRLFMLEDLSSLYVEVFGSHFWIDPFLFASQERAN